MTASDSPLDSSFPGLRALHDATHHLGLVERTRLVMELLSHYQVLVCNPNRTFGVLLLSHLQEWRATGVSQRLVGIAHTSNEGRSLIERVQGRLLVVTTVALQDGPVYGWSGELHRRSSPTKVLMLMDAAHRTTVKTAIDAGVDALLVQHNIGQGALLEALEALETGQRYLDPECRLALETRERASDELSEREMEILQLVAEGCSNREIAGRLSIAEVTARDHVQNILRKLRVDNRTAAVLAGVRQGYLHWTNT
ncbi:response regulator transcription factor [Synechococcus sp. CCY9201]|jgi:DNA-binding NarL/FixJ family response regulator|uniref:response regulator transcription factor n=1 Tax=unclassified Synechococcus TaxID=2626047 RepID=UPI0018CE1415|nr:MULTISPECIES: response regulator transcription factor [unclassified Synechococcus]MEA5421850.1 response regulator transcription factor [Synechococcus sp. CCY9202]MEA5474805.1 response regulator transcription factor [Synechococcus sp. CCY9201]QPN60415.1 response regulator transcription factor [Synechococcus sp. CBW1002]QPN67867.1 response regulator transcription factor [Synechococcus sp. CBW1006]